MLVQRRCCARAMVQLCSAWGLCNHILCRQTSAWQLCCTLRCQDVEDSHGNNRKDKQTVLLHRIPWSCHGFIPHCSCPEPRHSSWSIPICVVCVVKMSRIPMETTERTSRQYCYTEFPGRAMALFPIVLAQSHDTQAGASQSVSFSWLAGSGTFIFFVYTQTNLRKGLVACSY